MSAHEHVDLCRNMSVHVALRRYTSVNDTLWQYTGYVSLYRKMSIYVGLCRYISIHVGLRRYMSVCAVLSVLFFMLLYAGLDASHTRGNLQTGLEIEIVQIFEKCRFLSKTHGVEKVCNKRQSMNKRMRSKAMQRTCAVLWQGSFRKRN